VGPRAGLDTEARGKILCPCRGSNLYRPVVQPVEERVVEHCNSPKALLQLYEYNMIAVGHLVTGVRNVEHIRQVLFRLKQFHRLEG
jgi:hypothetical protein